MEGQYFKKTGKLVSLSEQQLIDCSWSFYNKGCTRGSMPFAFRYAIAFGMEPTINYPYSNAVCFISVKWYNKKFLYYIFLKGKKLHI